MAALRSYAPYVTLPAAAVIGFIGYNIEWVIRDRKNTNFKPESTLDSRNERKLKEIETVDPTHVESLKGKSDIPKTILGRNENFSQKLDS